jgi:hypothetical protein
LSGSVRLREASVARQLNLELNPMRDNKGGDLYSMSSEVSKIFAHRNGYSK